MPPTRGQRSLQLPFAIAAFFWVLVIRRGIEKNHRRLPIQTRNSVGGGREIGGAEFDFSIGQRRGLRQHRWREAAASTDCVQREQGKASAGERASWETRVCFHGV